MTEALLGPDRIKWIQAIRKEINECIRRVTFRKLDILKGHRSSNVVKSK
jgi:hypothetical protein